MFLCDASTDTCISCRRACNGACSYFDHIPVRIAAIFFSLYLLAALSIGLSPASGYRCARNETLTVIRAGTKNCSTETAGLRQTVHTRLETRFLGNYLAELLPPIFIYLPLEFCYFTETSNFDENESKII